MMFVFAISSVVAAGVLKNVVYAGASLMSFKFALFGMVLFLCLAFVVPLQAFAPVLKALKRQGLSRYGALLSQHNLAFEEKWIDGAAGAAGESLLGSPDVSSLADLSASYQLVSAMQTVPVTKESILPLVVAALVPLAAVAVTQAPLKQVLGELKGLLLL
jgi:ABC-type transport system involved in cytochrome bd biosynthesis fused ATPase/permease subunit